VSKILNASLIYFHSTRSVPKFPNFFRTDEISGVIYINKVALSSLKFRSQIL